MLHTRRPARLVVTFEGFLADIPDLSVPAGWGEAGAGRMRDRIRRHLRPYLGARTQEVTVEASPDMPTGCVLVPSSGREPGVAGYLHLEPETEDNQPAHRAGVPGWVVVAALVVLALLLLS